MTSRRTVLSTGTAILATAAARPVTANVGGCMTASSFGSMTPNTMASRSPGVNLQCSAYNVEYWRQQATFKPAWTITLIKDVLGSTGSSYDSSTIGSILAEATARTGALGVLQHLLSMVLAIQLHNIGTGDFNVAYIQNVWRSYVTTGHYTPGGSGVQWDDVQIITWLRYLMYGTTI